MKKEILKKVSVLLLTGIMLVGCGNNASDDDVVTGLSEDEFSKIMEELDSGKDVSELPDGLNLEQLTKIYKKHPYVVKEYNSLNQYSDSGAKDDNEYFVIDDFKITKEYWESTSVSEIIADLNNNVEWEKVIINDDAYYRYGDEGEKVDISSAKKAKKYIEEQIDDDGKIEGLYIHFIYHESKNCGTADELTFKISIEDINSKSKANKVEISYKHYSADDDRDFGYSSFAKKSNGTYYLFAISSDVYERKELSKDNL